MARDNPREGDERLSGSEKSGKPDAHPKSDKAGEKSGKAEGKSARKRPDDNLGRALKTVYDETLREDIPDEFRDLLGKLG